MIAKLRDISRTNLPLILILILAVLFRFIGSNPSYNQYHSDEGITYSSAVEMIKHQDLDPRRYDYPALIPLINYVFFNSFFIPIEWGKYYLTHSDSFPLQGKDSRDVFKNEILGQRDINALFWGRYVTALFSTLNVFLVFLLAKNLFNKNIGLIAALLLALNFRSITNSHIGLPDTYNAFFLLLSLNFNYFLLKKPTWKRYWMAGILLGLSFSTKYQIFAFLPFVVTHLYISFKDGFSIRKLLNPALILTGFSVLLVFLIINPYFFIKFDKALKMVRDVSEKYQMGKMQFFTFPYSYLFHIDYGLFESMIIIIGIFLGFWKFLKQTIFLLSVIVPFFFVMSFLSIGGFYVRNFITINPLLMIFGGIGVFLLSKELVGLLVKNKIIPLKKINNIFLVSILILLTLIVFYPLNNSLKHVNYYLKPWGYDVMVEKSKEVLPLNAKVAKHPFDKLDESKNVEIIDFKRESSYSLAEFRESGAEYGLINLDWGGDPFYGWMTVPWPESLKYWQKPMVKMADTYWGVTVAEMLDYTLVDAYKPWQAPDSALFLFKVPYFSNLDFLLKEKFDFDQNLNGWDGVNISQDMPFFYDQSTGFEREGSLKVVGGKLDADIVRVSSPLISVKPDYVYKILGEIKADSLIEKNSRTSFLRIDFFDYEEQPLEERKISVSPRYFGDDWKQLEVLSQSPNKAKFMKVSFQLGGVTSNTFWLDDVEVWESKSEFKDREYLDVPFSEYKDLLFPNSHGNL